ncbi:MAG: DNA repair protein RecO [Rickettsiaceae bacterium]|nr:DNA repair protein RecO [Rickettsiaceae bacterium]
MKISDTGIILDQKKFQEDKLLLKILSKNHGICSGLFRARSQNKLYEASVGNIIKFERFSRLYSQLGTLNCERIESFQRNIISTKQNLYLFKNFTNIILSSFTEYEPHIELFSIAENFLRNLGKLSYLDMCKCEIEILKIAGYGIDLSKCAVDGSDEDLAYVSPKSGKAVSRLNGQDYKHLLLKLPNFLHKNIEPEDSSEILAALDLTEYFFKRYIWHDKNFAHILSEREILRDIISTSMNNNLGDTNSKSSK